LTPSRGVTGGRAAARFLCAAGWLAAEAKRPKPGRWRAAAGGRSRAAGDGRPKPGGGRRAVARGGRPKPGGRKPEAGQLAAGSRAAGGGKLGGRVGSDYAGKIQIKSGKYPFFACKYLRPIKIGLCLSSWARCPLFLVFLIGV